SSPPRSWGLGLPRGFFIAAEQRPAHPTGNIKTCVARRRGRRSASPTEFAEGPGARFELASRDPQSPSINQASPSRPRFAVEAGGVEGLGTGSRRWEAIVHF